jgi:hypothetical protein
MLTGVTIEATGPQHHLTPDSDSISSHSNADTNSYHSNPDDVTPVPSPSRRRHEPTVVDNSSKQTVEFGRLVLFLNVFSLLFPTSA